MQGQEHVADILLVPPKSYDIIPGVQWLGMLRDIMWNFDKLRMQFWQ